METIEELAKEMFLCSKHFFMNSSKNYTLKEAYREVNYRGNHLRFDALSMMFRQNTSRLLTKEERRQLGAELNKQKMSLGTAKSNWEKWRNENYVLYLYMLYYHYSENTLIEKSETPDFWLHVDKTKIGIEISTLTPNDQNRLDTLANILHFDGEKSKKLASFLHDGYEIIPSATENAYFCRKPNSDPALDKSIAENLRLIERKLKQYASISSEHHISVVCDATQCFQLTSVSDCNSLFAKLIECVNINPNVDVVILFEDTETNGLTGLKLSEYHA